MPMPIRGTYKGFVSLSRHRRAARAEQRLGTMAGCCQCPSVPSVACRGAPQQGGPPMRVGIPSRGGLFMLSTTWAGSRRLLSLCWGHT
eukprot:CAMPEP_0204347538 /NCGR_PEP_ID=MMETSP0469-20131031/28031_1 /ASSEMBLY_ACC=CAM_ASM_000384 /TAXON_ID=2969 /ORGANISM="Oxyrrhis marina" /LENGTH=87 /DNA_ID=CAMNT_0051333361 /DNA_START=21 /DNA_END=281 /DNA_ORIENTATION=+